MNILFVCLGNICRSPLAEAVFTDLASREGVEVSCDSAGTSDEHEGGLSDPRTRDCARRHGLEITHRSRQVRASDFERFDLLIAMDQGNAAALRRRAPANARHKVHLLREWDPAGPGDVPDPWYGDASDFEHVWHLCERSMPGLLSEVRARMNA